MKGNASGLLGGAGFTTSVATAKESIPRLTAPFPAQLDVVPAPPPLGEIGTVLMGEVRSVLFLYVVYKLM